VIGIGHTTSQGAEIHPVGCDCAICREHRELTAIIEHAEARHWIVKPAAQQRLAQLEAERQSPGIASAHEKR
jgi:hypothetical protein